MQLARRASVLVGDRHRAVARGRPPVRPGHRPFPVCRPRPGRQRERVRFPQCRSGQPVRPGRSLGEEETCGGQGMLEPGVQRVCLRVVPVGHPAVEHRHQQVTQQCRPSLHLAGSADLLSSVRLPPSGWATPTSTETAAPSPARTSTNNRQARAFVGSSWNRRQMVYYNSYGRPAHRRELALQPGIPGEVIPWRSCDPCVP